jgi:hypothetical protein
LDAADEIERGVQRLVILRIRRDIGLRAGLLVAFGLKVSAQRRPFIPDRFTLGIVTSGATARGYVHELKLDG